MRVLARPDVPARRSSPCWRPATCARRRARALVEFGDAGARVPRPRRWPTRRCPTSSAATCRARISRFPAADAAPAAARPPARRAGRDGALQDPARPGAPGRREPRRSRSTPRVLAEATRAPSRPRSASWTGASRWRAARAEDARARDARPRAAGHPAARQGGAHRASALFRLLGLRHRGEDFEKIYRGLRSASAKVRASSRELLENLLEPPLREAVLALVDDVPDAAAPGPRARPSTAPGVPRLRASCCASSSTSRARRCAASPPTTWASWACTEFRPRLEAAQRGDRALRAAGDRARAAPCWPRRRRFCPMTAMRPESRTVGHVERILLPQEAAAHGHPAVVRPRPRRRAHARALLRRRASCCCARASRSRAVYFVVDGTLRLQRGGVDVARAEARPEVGGIAMLAATRERR